MVYNCFVTLFQGHAGPILYAAWAEAGLFPVEDLLNLRKVDSDLEGHPTPVSGDSIWKMCIPVCFDHSKMGAFLQVFQLKFCDKTSTAPIVH